MKRLIGGILTTLLLAFLILHFFGTYIGIAFFSRPIYVLPPSTERLAHDAFYILDKYGVYAAENNFEKKIPKFMEEVEGVKNFDKVVPIIDRASKLAGGAHSHYTELDESFDNQYFNENLQTFPIISEQEGVVRLTLPTFKSSQSRKAKKYVSLALHAFKNKSDIKGIILDLQGNSGGEIEPMLDAVTSLIPDGKSFYYISNKGKEPYVLDDKVWSYQGKKIFEAHSKQKLLNIPIGVLVNKQTASAAEITMIALKSNPNVKIFGEQTAGFATGVAIFPIYKQHALAIAGTKIQDVYGRMYAEEPISPDVMTDEPSKDALIWINTFYEKQK